MFERSYKLLCQCFPVDQTPHSPVAAYHSTPSLPSPFLSEVKEEPVEFQLENVKQETVEEDLRNLEIKQEPIDFPQDDFVTDINAPQFETVKIEVEDESDLCPACGDILSSTQSLTDHQCEKVSHLLHWYSHFSKPPFLLQKKYLIIC